MRSRSGIESKKKNQRRRKRYFSHIHVVDTTEFAGIDDFFNLLTGTEMCLLVVGCSIEK
jgi:hypothetical protein